MTKHSRITTQLIHTYLQLLVVTQILTDKIKEMYLVRRIAILNLGYLTCSGDGRYFRRELTALSVKIV